jgi:hypothetical protein
MGKLKFALHVYDKLELVASLLPSASAWRKTIHEVTLNQQGDFV